MDFIYCLRDVDEDLAGDIVGECTRISSSFDVYRSHNDPKGKSKIVFGHETVSPKVHHNVKSKVLVGDKGRSTKVHDSILYFDVIF
ncbi:hypothetical protein Hanom_Chr06g00565281 [Helianthus anomalus]